MLISLVTLSLFGCGSKKTGQSQNNVAESQEEMEEDLPDEEGDTIYIYSYNEVLGERLQYFFDLYPQYEQRVEFVNLEMGAASTEYQDTIRSLIKQGAEPEESDNDENATEEIVKYPSIVANDSVMASTFVQDDYSLPISSLGFTEEDTASMYPYTLNMASFQDNVKALTWYTTPGAFLYRADIAEEVFGDASPEAVQSLISTWTDFEQTAKKLKEAGYKVLSGPDEITYPMLQDKMTPWVQNESLRIDSNVKKCLELSKRLLEDDCTGETTITDNTRASSFDSDVFGWFVYPGEVYGGINTVTHEGDFRICQGPNAYQWGSTYLTVSPECPDQELAAFILKVLCCNEEVLEKMATETGDFVNNTSVMTKLADSEDAGLDVLGGQNPLETWNEVMDNMNADTVTPYDGRFDTWMREISVSYNAGKVENKKLFEKFKDEVSDNYNYLKIK
jgi:hypothetical protein